MEKNNLFHNYLVNLSAEVTQYCHLLKRQGNMWDSLMRESCETPG